MNFATLKQAGKVLELITQNEVPSEQMQEILGSGLLSDLLIGNIGGVNREEFRRVLGLVSLMPKLMELTGVVIPGPERLLPARITEGGYDWHNSDITPERFQLLTSPGPANLFLAHFNKTMTSEKVEKWAAENGYEVAKIDDLLAVGSHGEYKELQRQFPILALGSSAVVDGGRDVPYLDRYDSKRDLYLGWYGGDWGASCRFLLRKAS